MLIDVGRYVMRKTPLGPVFYRIEPYEDVLFIPYESATEQSRTVAVYDMLYAHFQIEKYKGELVVSLSLRSSLTLCIPSLVGVTKA
jgi:hypothetical protein